MLLWSSIGRSLNIGSFSVDHVGIPHMCSTGLGFRLRHHNLGYLKIGLLSSQIAVTRSQYFCVCHDSSIIVTCAKFRCGWIARMSTTVKFDLGCLNTLTPRHNYRHFTDDIFKCFFLNENVWISLKMSLKLVLKIRINNIPALLQIIVWRWLGDKPLSELMMVKLLTHKCVTRPLWVNSCRKFALYTYGNGITGQSYVLYVWCIGTPHSNLQ